MADKAYLSSKQTTKGTAMEGGSASAFPATKSQIYGANRPTYRPQPKRRQHSRGCCCTLCIWLILAVITFLLVIAIATAAIYLIYRPHRPSFTVTSLKVSYINVTSSSKLNSKLDITIAARNPNKKIVYFYDPMDISVSSNDVDVGEGIFSSFRHSSKNTTALKASIGSSSQALDSTSASALKVDLKNKNGLLLKIEMETKVQAKMGAIKSPKLRLRVTCDGIKATVPTGKTGSTTSATNDKCKIDIRIKIWKWNL